MTMTLPSNLTNRFGLPDEIVAAIVNDPYDNEGADISVTQLIGPPRLRVLKKRHAHKAIEDVSDRLWSLYGKAVHKVLEMASCGQIRTEERLAIEVNGWSLSGQVDVYDPKRELIRDYKFVGVGSTFDGAKDEWINQLNVYAHIWRCNGYEVNQLEVACLYRDWIKTKALTDSRYPPPIQIFEIPLWRADEAESYVLERLDLHQIAEQLPDDQLPPCTPEERWERPTYWRLMKKGRKTALKRFATGEEAKEACLEKQELDPRNTYYIEEVPGEPMRCKLYCPVLPFCNVGKTLVGESDG